jgi:cytosine deaminase
VKLLRSARLVDGRVVDIAIDETAGTIAELREHDPAAPPEPGQQDQIDLDGYLVLPAPAEPHAHLDKAFTADLVPNPAGDLGNAIANWMAHYPDRTVPEITARARRAVLENLRHGATAVRTHVDVNPLIGYRAIDALMAVRDEVADLVDLQIVALIGRPLVGPDGDGNRRLLAEIVKRDIDLVGGAPHIDPDSHAHLDLVIEAANQAGLGLDLHMDESLNPESRDLAYLAECVTTSGFAHQLTASHCVSLGIQPEEVQKEVAAAAAAADISVVTLPQTNLFLQGRGIRVSAPRALTAVRSLLDAGVNLAAGADNLQDPFNTVGRGDPLETAALMVMAAHLTPEQAYHAVSNAARRALGLPEVHVLPGDPAELLAIKASNLREAVASAPVDRMVFHRGRLVARTNSNVEINPAR